MAGLNLRTRNDHILTPEESYNQLFGVPKVQSDIIKLKCDQLVPYPDQPFKPYSEDKLAELAADIKQNGILSPILVKPITNADGTKQYMILAGHNRVNACKLAEIEGIPSIIKDVDETTAQLIMLNTNLNQRDKLLPSEKAFAYKMQHEANKCQGKRNDLTLDPMGPKLDCGAQNDDKSLNSANFRPNGSEVDNKSNIKRYIRLTNLTHVLLSSVDDSILPFRAGVALSYITTEEQNLLHDYTDSSKKRISISQAEQIKEYCNGSKLTVQILDRIFNPIKTAATSIKINMKKLSKLIPEDETENAESYILKALEFYKLNKGDEDGDLDENV